MHFIIQMNIDSPSDAKDCSFLDDNWTPDEIRRDDELSMLSSLCKLPSDIFPSVDKIPPDADNNNVNNNKMIRDHNRIVYHLRQKLFHTFLGLYDDLDPKSTNYCATTATTPTFVILAMQKSSAGVLDKMINNGQDSLWRLALRCLLTVNFLWRRFHGSGRGAVTTNTYSIVQRLALDRLAHAVLLALANRSGPAQRRVIIGEVFFSFFV
jgi:hypothetical protein